MPFDAHKNFARSLVGTAPSPATTGTSLVVTAAEGVKFPAVPFNAVVAPAGTLPSSTNAEIVRVTAIATDTLTITRAQESTTARTIVAGDQIVAAITAKSLVDIEVGGSATVTSLPATPVDGQECYYLADSTSGIVWHLKYRSGSASAYKWEFVGGAPLFSEVNPGIATSQTTNSTTYVDLATVGPSLTAALAGDYAVIIGFVGNTTGAALMSYAIGATAAIDENSIYETITNTWITLSKSRTHLAIPANSAIVAKYRSASGTTDFRGRWMYLTPVRVG